MLLYKCAHKYGVESLRSLELKVTRFDQFNDPFEFLPTVVSTAPVRTIRRFANDKEVQRHMYERMKSMGYRGSFKEYRSKFLKTRKETIQFVAENPEIPAKIRENLLNSIKSNWGVLCFSAVPDNTLMWSHYADCHRGVVFGFDFEKCSAEWSVKLHKVAYTDKCVEMNLKWMPGTVGHKAFIMAMATTKNAAWKCENEYRLLFKLLGLKTRSLPDGSTGYFTGIPRDAIREVILGCRSTSETERDLRKTLATDQFKHVTLRRATIHDSSFGLVLKSA